MGDVELGEGDFEAEGCEEVLRGDQGGAVGGLADAEVGLETESVDGYVCGLHELDDAHGGGGFARGGLEVEVVVVKAGRGIGARGGGEGERDEVGAEGAEEDGVAKGAVVVEGFVDDVPGVAEAAVVGHDVGDVRDDDGCEGVARPGAVGDEGGEL